MAMGIISDEDFDLELVRLSGKHSEVIITGSNNGRGPTKELPDSLRKVISEEAIVNGNTKDIAEAFGISKSSVDAYKNDATSCKTYDNPNDALQEHNNKVRARINGIATNRIMKALKHITEDKMKDAKIDTLSTVAANMARVVEKTTPKERPVVNNNIVFYSPRQIHERNFEIVEVN